MNTRALPSHRSASSSGCRSARWAVVVRSWPCPRSSSPPVRTRSRRRPAACCWSAGQLVGPAPLAGRSGAVRRGVAFGLTGIGGSLLGTAVNKALDPDVLLLGFSVLVLVAAWRMVTGCPSCTRVGEEAVIEGSDGVETAESVACTSSSTHVDVARDGQIVAAGTGVGFLTGLFGVGGGFVIVPALTLVVGLSMPMAIGTSLVVITINRAVALDRGSPRPRSTGRSPCRSRSAPSPACSSAAAWPTGWTPPESCAGSRCSWSAWPLHGGQGRRRARGLTPYRHHRRSVCQHRRMHTATIVDGHLEWREHPDPVPGTGEVLVRVHAAGLNGADRLQVAGLSPPPPGGAGGYPRTQGGRRRGRVGRGRHRVLTRRSGHGRGGRGRPGRARRRPRAPPPPCSRHHGLGRGRRLRRGLHHGARCAVHPVHAGDGRAGLRA